MKFPKTWPASLLREWDCKIGERKQATMTMATGTSLNKGFIELNNSCARAL